MANDTGLPFLHEPPASGFAPGIGEPLRLPFDNLYARLPERFYARLPPTPVAAPSLIKLNTALAAQLGLDAEALASPQGVAVLAGNSIAPGSEPISLAYAGHQFGNFVPQLGDGRAVLLGEIVGPDGIRRDIQLKGSGPTPFSRRGDGRAALGPVLREYIISEAMAALGIPTTRSLAAVTTGEPVVRETALPGAVAMAAAFAGMFIGQAVRSRMQPDVFRRWFLIAMILLGIYLAGSAFRCPCGRGWTSSFALNSTMRSTARNSAIRT